MYSRVYVEITNICNMHCSFCHGHGRPFRLMQEAEFCHLLSALAGKTEHLYYHLMGEPLLHPLLPHFVALARERGFKSVITTNGSLLYTSRGAKLIEAAPHKVSVSLHSFEKQDDAGLARYIGEVADFADAASEKGIIVVLRLWNKGHDGGRNDRILLQLRARFPHAEWAQNTRGIRIRNKLHVEFGERFIWPDKNAPDEGSDVFCYGLADHFGILCDGTVVPCCMDSDGVIALGNLFEKPLSDILSTPRAEAIERGFACRTATEELCRRCSYARRFL